MIIHPLDNVEVGDDGQKYALCDIKKGDNVIKYGFAIGHATADIKIGERVGPKNLATNLAGRGEWEYKPISVDFEKKNGTFKGYLRENGEVGIRNELWIIPTVGCINNVVRTLADKHGGRALTHPYGCSQLGGDLETTQKTLAGLVRHPNAGGVLLVGLGCEENLLSDMIRLLGDDYNKDRVKFLNIQDCGDEYAEADTLIAELKEKMSGDTRTEVPISKLRVAVKCGGSDGYSGITANPLCGRVSERFYEYGATVLMTEVPETFGAEQLLLSRAKDKKTFDAASKMIKDFRQYYIDQGQPISENPSPGNVAGGITTLEEKSLGCVQKAGRVPLCGALNIGERPGDGGLYIVHGPGNDMVAVTNLAASGAHIIMFTTGRGTPLSSPVPTLKIATNTALADKKPHWIDLDAMKEDTDALFALCIATAEGKPTKAETIGAYDIAIFKNGVTL